MCRVVFSVQLREKVQRKAEQTSQLMMTIGQVMP